MENIFGAYLEDYHYIKLIVPTYEYFDVNNLWLVGNNEKIQMRVFKSEQFGNEFHIHASFKGIICLHKDYQVDIDGRVTYNLTLGKITKTARFELDNYYEGPLGFEYKKDYTIFRVWTPVAKELRLALIDKNGKEEELYFQYIDKGLWIIKVEGDLDGFGYYLKVRINSKLHSTLDPYAIASAANHKYNYIIDFNKTYPMKNGYWQSDKAFNYVDSVICELSIRDVTSGLNIENPGTYDALTATKNENVGLGYLKNIGYTHLQLMPIYAFGGVDETCKTKLYNWGYNPVQYNVPSGFFSNNPDLPYARINELKRLIDTIHSLNMGVNMDVVYNHVYEYDKFSYAVLVPGYFFRDNSKGYMTSSSGCGNDFASDKKMAMRFIIDSVIFWQHNYCIDGFRFDLMGLIDVDTMNEINNVVKTVNPFAMIYGEGWNMDVAIPTNKRANMNNFWATPGIAYFNDTFRNNMKANFNNTQAGYAMGGFVHSEVIQDLLLGSCVNECIFDSPNRTINYVECHDNYTFYDNLRKVKPDLKEEDYDYYVLLSLGVIAFSQGIPFYHLGEEGKRSKKGYDNSYNLSDEFNKIDWNRIKDNQKISNALKAMLEIRKKHKLFRLNDAIKIKNAAHFDKQTSLIGETLKKEVCFKLKNKTEVLQVILKNDFEDSIFYFAPGTKLIFNGLDIVNEEVSTVTLNKPGAYILKKD